MTVRELIEELNTLPKDYQVVYETGESYRSACYAYVNEIIINDKTKEVELY